MGPASTVRDAFCNTALSGSPVDSSAKETEGAQVGDVRPVTTGDESPVGAERAQTVAGISSGMMAVLGI